MKNTTMKIFSTALLLVGLSTQSYAKVTDEIERSFDVKSDAKFALENVNGSVEISAWDNSVIQVTAILSAKNQDHLDRIKVEMNETSNGISVETKYEKSNWSNSNNSSGQVKYIVRVPRAAELETVSLVNGSLVISNVEGQVNAELVNGSIKASGLANNGKFSSVNGSVKVSYKTLSNSMNRIRLETVNGSIKLYVPDALNADVEAETMHGSIKNDFGLSVNKNMFSGKHMTGKVGSGDIAIQMQSVNGSVKLIKN